VVGVVTRLAGVFYLINAMLRLRLLELFEAEWQLTSRIGAWGLLELLARGLLVDSPEELTTDPLWAALASLNNRQPDEPPGRDYSTTGVLALPPGFATFEEVDVSAARLAASPFLKDVVPDLISWLNLVLPTIMVSLCQAMQQPTLTTFSEIAKGVLRYDGHLIVTAAHVDLIFDLDDISLPLRLAGLDTDPGWLPAFGRVIRFHFE
jgi:hypothetical protein